MFVRIASLSLLSQFCLLFSSLINEGYCQSSMRVTIVHTSDIHLHFFEDGTRRRSESSGACEESEKCHGGLARFVKYVKDLRGLRSNLLVLDSGGLIPGKMLQVEEGRLAVAEVVAPLPYDAMAFGAVELSGGVDALADYVRTVGEKFVCTNLEFSLSSESGKYLSKSCHKTMIKMYGELQIGILSYITKETVIERIPGITIKDEVEALKAGISELEATSADISVILALGYSRNAVDKTILKEVPKINLIISGHSHVMFYNSTPPSGAKKDLDYPHIVHHPEVGSSSRPGSNQLVAGAYFHLIYAGKLQLLITDQWVTVDPQATSNPVYLDGEKDPETVKWLNYHKDTLAALLGFKIGFNTFLLDGSRECQRRECTMGNVLADAMVTAAVMSEESPPAGTWAVSAVALLDSGHISSSMERGAIYAVDLQNAVRETSLELLRVSGAELQQLLENSIGSLPAGSESFLQVSGCPGDRPGAGRRPPAPDQHLCGLLRLSGGALPAAGRAGQLHGDRDRRVRRARDGARRRTGGAPREPHPPPV